jgi:hypothetical protein
MPNVLITDADDAKLKQLVTEPFDQTRESIIRALIDGELVRRASKASATLRANAGNGLMQLNPDKPGKLAHTKLVSATIDGTELNRPKWNGVRERMHVIGMRRLGAVDKVQRVSGARLRAGKFEKDGFKYLPEGFSIQGVDSHLCWDQSLRLARDLGVPISLTIEWREKEGAAHPGKTAVLEWKPKTS